MRKQRWCGALLALALVLTLLPTAAFAEGTGTKDDPILISTADDLKDFRNHVNGTGYYGEADPTLCAKLMNDIVLNDGTFDENGTYTKGASGKTAEPWTPIGGYNGPSKVSYTGTFDGGGHTIKGLYINNNQSYIGLFGFVNNATIQNLTVTGYVKGGSYVGGIVGQAEGSSTIQNCVNYSSVKGDGSGVGGLVGWASNGSITIQNCVNYSTVTGSSGVGGIVGHAVDSSTIQNCINLGTVTGKRTVGGLVGSFYQGSIQNCANLGGVKGSENYTGGIVGYAVNSTKMTACYNAGEVKGTSCVGGLLGWGSLNMTSCYNVGRVEGTNSAGGLVGSAAWSENGGIYTSSLTVSSCYYLNTAATGALGTAEHFTGDTSQCSKTKTEFANGDVLALLKQGASTAWADNCGYLAVGMTLPLLSGQTADAHNHTAETGDCTKGIFCTCGHKMHDAETEHSYPDNWTASRPGSTHSKKCLNDGCGVTKSESCSGGTATCKELATCTVCGGSYGSKDEANHSDLQRVPAKAATTTAEGNIEYWYCPGCGKYFKDAAATDEITQVETVTAKLPGSIPYYPPSYAASVEKTEHGSVSVSPKTAAAGTTVTVTVTPDRGYTLETLTVTDAGGKELPLTDKGDGRYTFTQPASKVTVRAAFMDDNTMLNFFADVKSSDYYYDAVLWAAQKGITSGISATEFGPNQPCSRAQIVTFLWRAAGSPVVNYAMSMDDVNEGNYYAEAVRWALSLGVTTGTGDNAFSPDASCTRAQAVTFLARALNAKASGKAAFSDVPSGSYYADAVAWAAESGVTTGTSADAFSPDDVCTRAQIVTFLYRAFQ